MLIENDLFGIFFQNSHTNYAGGPDADGEM